MQSKTVKYFAVLAVIGCSAGLAVDNRGVNSQKRPIDYVNALVGTAPLGDPTLIGNAPPPGEELYTGMTSPGAVLPHGVTNLAPINKNLDLSYPAGVGMSYNYTHPVMLGFSSAMPGLMVMPVVGYWTVPPERSAAYYDKAKEKAVPGYYTVYLNDFRTKVELTATAHTGMYRFTFPQSPEAHVVMDLGRAGGDIQVIGDHTIRGQAQRGFRGQIAGTSQRGAAQVYFVAEFSKPFGAFGTFHQNPPVQQGRGSLLGSDSITADSRSESGSYAGVYLDFPATEREQVLIKIASGESFEQAQKYLEAESPGWNFDGIRARAAEAWANKLNAIEVKGGTEHARTLFYSNLYHSFASPRLIARKGESFRGLDGAVKMAEHDRYGPVPFWDTGRDQLVLLTLVEPDVKQDILSSTLDMAKETGYMQTSFHGDHAVWMYLGDWERGLRFDWESAYEYLRKNATDTKGPRRNLAEYLEKGWISDIVVDHPSPPYAGGNAGVAKTLEYSWDDYSLATYAKKLGKQDDYQMFLKRAHNYKNVFDPCWFYARTDCRWKLDFSIRSQRAVLQLHDEGGVGMVDSMAGAARRPRADQSAGWPG